MNHIAVLGANGFIGSRTVELLQLRQMATVRPIVRHWSSLARLARFDLDCRLADGRDQAALHQAFDGCDAVIHAIAGDPQTIEATIVPVYQAAQAVGVRRLVYLSSASVHGQAPPPGTDETSPLNSHQPIAYNNAKVRAEQQLQRLRERGMLELVVLRPGIVYGPRSSWLVTLADALLGNRAYLVNDGTGICNSLYVDTLVEAMLLALTTPAADRQTFLLGDHEVVTWAEFYRPVAEALGFRVEDIARVRFAPAARTRHEHMDALLRSAPSQRVLRLLPSRLRSALGAGVYRFLESPPRADAAWRWSPEIDQNVSPQPSLEMALLQGCHYKVPHAKATALLGYQPGISFEEAMRRSVAWLGFAGYPVQELPAWEAR